MTVLRATLTDTLKISLPATDADGVAYSVTDATAWFYAKTRLSDADADAVLSATTDAGTITCSGSTVTVTVPASQMASITRDTTLLWACRIKESSSAQVTTLDSGQLHLTLAAVKTYA